MIEEYLRNQDGSGPLNYKFWCFAGVPEVIHISNCADVHTSFFDTEWNHLDLSTERRTPRPALAKPINFEQMLLIASQLSAGFDFVRVDLYNMMGKYILESLPLRLWPASSKLRPESWDLALGRNGRCRRRTDRWTLHIVAAFNWIAMQITSALPSTRSRRKKNV